MKRASGILLHPTSLPSPFGVGDLGENAFRFLEKIAECGSTWWQVLPLTPPDSYGSPYASSSAFALNPVLVDPIALKSMVDPQEWERFKDKVALFDDDYFDVATVTEAKTELWRKAFSNFESTETFVTFCEDRHSWLHDFALFEALRTEQQKPWWHWSTPLVERQETALQEARGLLENQMQFVRFQQFIVEQQWSDLRAKAAELDVKILGDIPIFVSMNSADVWANRRYFNVGADGKAIDVAGVPPDYFSPTGQKWGNPLYDWDALKEDNYRWWIARINRACELADLSRIDHFRGFSEYWAVPADAPTAETGEWRSGPGAEFFDVLKQTYGDVPFVAEDLGLITDDVIQLRDEFQLPGMRVMQFGFDDDNNEHAFRPHTFPKKCVAYIGTHDNDTLLGWFESAPDETRHRTRVYFSCADEDVPLKMLSSLFESGSDLVFATPQDLLGLDSSARMNTPGKPEGNWSWRMRESQFEDPAWQQLFDLNHTSKR